MDILKFIEKTHPLKFIFFFLFVVSVTLNIAQLRTNRETIEKLKKATRPIILVVPPEQTQPSIKPPDELFTIK